MQQSFRAIALGVALAGGVLGSGSIRPARAAPPTVVPSPGYDARLQEQRAASQRSAAAKPAYDPAPRRRLRRHYSLPR